MYSLGDGPGGLLVLSSAVTLALIAREISAAHPITRHVRAAFLWAAVSIAAVSGIYFAFAWSVPVGVDVRPWAKAVSGLAASVSAWHGWQVARAARP